MVLKISKDLNNIINVNNIQVYNNIIRKNAVLLIINQKIIFLSVPFRQNLSRPKWSTTVIHQEMKERQWRTKGGFQWKAEKAPRPYHKCRNLMPKLGSNTEVQLTCIIKVLIWYLHSIKNQSGTITAHIFLHEPFCLGMKLTWDRGEMLTILSKEKDDKMLVRDSKGNEQLVPSTYITELSSSVRHSIKCCI